MSRMTILSQWAQAAAKPAFQMSQSLIKVLYKQTFCPIIFYFILMADATFSWDVLFQRLLICTL